MYAPKNPETHPPFRVSVDHIEQRIRKKGKDPEKSMEVIFYSRDGTFLNRSLVTASQLRGLCWLQESLPRGLGFLNEKGVKQVREDILHQAQECETEVIVYEDEGMTSDSQCFIFADTLIPIGRTSLPEDFKADTGYTLSDYGITDEQDPQEVTQDVVDHMVSLLPPGKSVILFTFLLTGSLKEYLQNDPLRRSSIMPRSVLALIGRSGAGKSTIAEAVFASRHRERTTTYLPTCTQAYLARELGNSFSCVHICDDVAPEGNGKLSTPMIELLEFIMRSMCDTAGARKNASSGMSEGEYPCCVVLTAEKRAWTKPSTILRTVEVLISEGECDFQCASWLSQHYAMLNRLILMFVEFIACQSGFLDDYAQCVCECEKILATEYGRMTRFQRVLRAHAQLIAFFDTAMEPFLTKYGIPSDKCRQMHQTLKAELKLSAERQSSAVQAGDYDDLIAQEIVSYFVSAGQNGEIGAMQATGKKCYSYQGSQEVKALRYADTLFLCSKQKSMLRANLQSTLDTIVSATRLHKALQDMGIMHLPIGLQPSQYKIHLNGRETKAVPIDFSALKAFAKEESLHG